MEKKVSVKILVSQWEVGRCGQCLVSIAYSVKWNRKCANMQCAPLLLRVKLEKKAFKYATWQLSGLASPSNEESCRQKAAHLTITTCIMVLSKSSALCNLFFFMIIFCIKLELFSICISCSVKMSWTGSPG